MESNIMNSWLDKVIEAKKKSADALSEKLNKLISKHKLAVMKHDWRKPSAATMQWHKFSCESYLKDCIVKPNSGSSALGSLLADCTNITWYYDVVNATDIKSFEKSWPALVLQAKKELERNDVKARLAKLRKKENELRHLIEECELELQR